MRHMVFLRPGKLEWRDAPDPKITGPLEAIVRPMVCGRCDLDAAYVAGRMPLAEGEPIGHEIIGEIVDLGDKAAQRFALGDRVIVSAQICCGACPPCRRGDTGRCASVPLGSSYGMGRGGGYGGGVAELVRVPFATGMLTPIPKTIAPEQLIGLADMAADSWRAVGPQLAARPGASVLVGGGWAPVIGLYAAGLAVALGAGRVVYLDTDASRRALALAYGAEAVASAAELDGAQFEIVVDAAGDAETLNALIAATAPAGRLTSVAPPFALPGLSLLPIYYKGLTWEVGRPNCAAGHRPAIAAWSGCGFKPELVGPKVFAFDEAPEAWIDPALYVAVTRA